EELLADQRLQRGRVVGPDAAGERLVEGEEGDQRFAGPGRGGHDRVVAGEDGQEGLILGRVGFDTDLGAVLAEGFVDGVVVSEFRWDLLQSGHADAQTFPIRLVPSYCSTPRSHICRSSPSLTPMVPTPIRAWSIARRIVSGSRRCTKPGPSSPRVPWTMSRSRAVCCSCRLLTGLRSSGCSGDPYASVGVIEDTAIRQWTPVFGPFAQD